MKNLQKVLALALSATMALSMFVTGVGAAFTDQADIKSQEAVNMLTALGVIDGNPDGSFKPEGTVTRAEMAKMIYVVMSGGSKTADAYATLPTTFKDINSHWAAGYIKFCQSNGIIAGKSATQFDPDALVTGTEAAKMLLVVMGYTPDKAGLTGPAWSTNTVGLATQSGLLKDVNASMTEGLPRQYAAQVIYNTLDANRMKWSTDANAFDYFLNNDSKEKVGYKYLKLCTDVGTMTVLSKDTLKIEISNVDNPDSFHGIGSQEFTKVGTDFSNLLGQKVKVLFRDGKTNDVLGIYPVTDNDSMTVNAKDVERDGTKVKFGGKSYSLEAAAGQAADTIKVDKVTISGTQSTANLPSSDAMFSDTKQNPDVYTFVDTNGNGKLDNVIVTEYSVAKVTYVSGSQVIAGATYKFEDEKIDDDLKVNDWVMISYDRYNDCKKIEKADMITGKLTATKTDTRAGGASFKQYQVDDKWYNASTNTSDHNTVKASNNVEAVAVHGVLYYIKRTSGTSGTISDVAVVINKSDDIGGKRAAIQYFDGTTETVTVNNDTGLKYNGIAIGGVYEYTKTDGKFVFENLKFVETSAANDEYYGDYTAHNTLALANMGGDNATVGGTKIADTAKVILVEKKTPANNLGNDSKVVTGKQFKNTVLAADIVGANALAMFTADMSGLKQAGAVVVEVKALPSTIVTKDNYAYIVKAAVETGTNEVSYQIWTGSEKITVYEEHNSLNDRKKGHVIGYKSLEDISDSDNKKIKDVSRQTMVGTSITGFNSNTVQFDDAVNGYNDLDRVSNTRILNVDSDPADGEEIGISASELRKADKDGNGFYIKNALVLGSGNDIEVIVVDIKNKMKSPYIQDTGDRAVTQPTAAGKVTATSIKTSAGVAITTETFIQGTELQLNMTIAANTDKVAIALTGAEFVAGQANLTIDAEDASKAVFTGATTATLRIKTTGTATVGATFTAANTSITVATDVSNAAIDSSEGSYTTKTYKNGTVVAAGATAFDVGDKLEVRFLPTAAGAATKSDKIDVLMGTTNIGSVTFNPAEKTAKTLKTVTYTVTAADTGTITYDTTSTLLDAPTFVVDSVKIYDALGDVETTAVTEISKISIQFAADMDKAAVEDKSKWTATTLTVESVVYDEATRTATFTVTGAADSTAIAAQATTKSVEGVAMVATSKISLATSSPFVSVANT